MDKLTYLAELAEGLARWVPERERQDILRYYAEYFEEAGPDREAEVIQELGDPWALSCRLAVDGGFVTQQQASSWTPRKKKRWPWIALGAAAVLVFIIGSVATAAARIGRVIGQAVYDTATVDVVEGVPIITPYVEFGITAIEDPWIGAGTWIVGDGSLEVFDAIDAEIGLGSIVVVAGDDYTLFVEQDVDWDGCGLDWEIKDGTLKIRDGGKAKQVEVNDWDDFKNLFGAGQRALNATITVPENAVLDKVSVKTGLGNVELWDVSAEKVTAETGWGDVECYNLRQVKKMELDTGMGNVTLGMDEPCSGVDIDLESGLGNVEASLGCPEAECRYELESGLGTVTVDSVSRGSKAERKGNLPYKLDAESGKGDVNVYFYGD